MPDRRQPDRREPLPERVDETSYSLLDLLKQNHAEAWQRLVTLYSPLIRYWCRKLDLPEQEIADIVQNVFQSVSRHIGQFRKEKPSDSFRGWLRTITRNKSYDHLRKQAREPRAVGGTEAHHRIEQLTATVMEADEGSDHQAHRELFERALNLIRSDFAERTWKAFWRVTVDGQAPKDVAEELSMKPGTVRVAKSRVLSRLRQELGDVLDEW